MQSFVKSWTYRSPAAAFEDIADHPYALLFDGMCKNDPRSRYSYLCLAPLEIIESKNGRVTLTNADLSLSIQANPFDVIRDRLAHYGMDKKSDPTLPPFQGGVAGSFGYDLGRHEEVIPSLSADNPDIPDMMVGIYDSIIAYDHLQEKAWFISHADEERRQKIQTLLSQKRTLPHKNMHMPENWQPDCDDAAYLNKIRTVIDYIFAGDIYQANLSRRFTATIPEGFDSYTHYLSLRTQNPAPFSSYMHFGDITLASCSPERFLKMENGIVETRPIKGTLDSTFPPSILLNSEKDRAENLMIVDLMRNDLGKVCKTGSISVPELFSIETFEGLHHMVSAVTGIVKDGISPLDVLKACFPGGSVTGAPKIRAMEIIEELEPNRRGPYCGTIGMIGFNGFMDTSITIRTLIYEGGLIHLQTGSGIVADSNPQDELDETLLKAQKIFGSFKHIRKAA